MANTKVKISDIQNGLTAKIDGQDIPIVGGVIDTTLLQGNHVIKFYSGSVLMFEKSLVVPKSTEDAIIEATVGLKTPEQVQAELESLLASSNYINVLEKNLKDETITLLIPTKTTFNATKIKVYLTSGYSNIIDIPESRTVVLPIPANTYNKLELLSGNNKVVDSFDLEYNTVLPTPPAVQKQSLSRALLFTNGENWTKINLENVDLQGKRLFVASQAAIEIEFKTSEDEWIYTANTLFRGSSVPQADSTYILYHTFQAEISIKKPGFFQVRNVSGSGNELIYVVDLMSV